MIQSVILATDGSPAAVGAASFAQRLEHEKGMKVQVVGVVQPLPVFDTGFLVAPPELEIYQQLEEALRAQIAVQLDSLAPHETWEVHTPVGSPAHQIVSRAEELGAELIVLGLGRHKVMDRWFGSETALHVARLSSIPVLAVPTDARELPSRGLAAVDFSTFSVDGIETATRIMRDTCGLQLAHVVAESEFISAARLEEYRSEAKDRLNDLAARFQPPTGCTLRTDVPIGVAADTIMEMARGMNADMIIAGSHGNSFMGRLILGSVSTRIMRASECSVLIEPPSHPAEHTT